MKKYLLLFTVLAMGTFSIIQFNNNPRQHNLSDTTIDHKKLTGAEKFALYHSNIRKSPEGSPFSYKSGYQTSEYQKLKKRLPETGGRELNWEERGPGNVSGRTRTVWVDPSDDSGETWFVGSAQGGVWKTEDAGMSYILKTPDVPHLGTAAIMGCNSVPDVIYAGSGEGFNFLSAAGAGIFKTTDGGETWTVLSSTTNNDKFGNVYRIAVHPDDPNIVYAATRNNNSASDTQGFVMRSKDGGETWEEILFHFDVIPHITMSPGNPDILFAGLNQEGVLKSVDGGDNWDFVWLYESPELRPGRIELAISPSDPNFVYFTTPINDEDFFPGDKIYVSDDGGETFQLVIANNGKDDYSGFSGGQSFWNKAIAVDPFNPSRIYFAGQSAMLRMDIQVLEGLVIGELDVISDGYGSYSEYYDVGTKGVHVDHHGITFSIVDEATQEVIMINTNDGGVAVSRDNGATFLQTGDTFLQGFNPEKGNWTTVNGYNVSTFYGVDKMNGGDRYVGGTQDNGSWVSPEDPDEASEWSYAPSGDGFEAAWNYDNPDMIIESSQFNNFSRSLDGGLTWSALETPSFGPFISAIANSKQDGYMLAISTIDGPAISQDFGNTWTMSSVPDEYQFGGLSTPIDISLFDPKIIWTGTRVNFDNRICLSTDGGLTFTATAQYDPQELGRVAGIATHPADLATAYALFGVAGQPKIIRTTDSGQTWNDISGFEGTVDGTSSRGFPDVAVFSLLVMPYDNNIIWAGTEIGIIESLDNGESWNLIDDGLPATAIWEMKIINDEVVLATHGRGIWTTSLPELEGYEPPTPFLIASNFEGISFDKKLTGQIRHLTPIDSGMLTITVETDLDVLTRTYPLGKVDAPSSEDINLDLEDFDVGDYIYDAQIDIVVYRENEERQRSLKKLFYDVDADDPYEIYEDDFNDGNDDFAVGKLKGESADFQVATPTNFVDNGLRSRQSIFEVRSFRTIFQKPITITQSGATLSFDEIALTTPTNGFNFQESIIIEATNNKGKNWVRFEEYSSEIHENWASAVEFGTEVTNGFYRKRSIKLSDYFEEGDEVYFKLEMRLTSGSNSWGYILDNFTLTNTVSTKEALLEKGISSRTLNNPFINSTSVELVHPNSIEVGTPILMDASGQVIEVQIQDSKSQNGKIFNIDGSNLSSGIYFFKVRAGNEIITEKIIKI